MKEKFPDKIPLTGDQIRKEINPFKASFTK